jgi:hypothetical protein
VEGDEKKIDDWGEFALLSYGVSENIPTWITKYLIFVFSMDIKKIFMKSNKKK